MRVERSVDATSWAPRGQASVVDYRAVESGYPARYSACRSMAVGCAFDRFAVRLDSRVAKARIVGRARGRTYCFFISYSMVAYSVTDREKFVFW